MGQEHSFPESEEKKQTPAENESAGGVEQESANGPEQSPDAVADTPPVPEPAQNEVSGDIDAQDILDDQEVVPLQEQEPPQVPDAEPSGDTQADGTPEILEDIPVDDSGQMPDEALPESTKDSDPLDELPEQDDGAGSADIAEGDLVPEELADESDDDVIEQVAQMAAEQEPSQAPDTEPSENTQADGTPEILEDKPVDDSEQMPDEALIDSTTDSDPLDLLPEQDDGAGNADIADDDLAPEELADESDDDVIEQVAQMAAEQEPPAALEGEGDQTLEPEPDVTDQVLQESLSKEDAPEIAEESAEGDSAEQTAPEPVPDDGASQDAQPAPEADAPEQNEPAEPAEPDPLANLGDHNADADFQISDLDFSEFEQDTSFRKKAQKEPAPEQVADFSVDSASDESVLKSEIENLGKILEESLSLQKEIAEEKRQLEIAEQEAALGRKIFRSNGLVGMRWFIAAGALLGMFVQFRLMLLVIAGYVVLFNLLNYYQIKKTDEHLLDWPVLMINDIITITAIVHLTGEVNSPMFLLYYVLVGFVGVYYPILISLGITGAVAIAYSLYLLSGPYFEINVLLVILIRCIPCFVVLGWAVLGKYVAGYYRKNLKPVVAKAYEELKNQQNGTAEQPKTQAEADKDDDMPEIDVDENAGKQPEQEENAQQLHDEVEHLKEENDKYKQEIQDLKHQIEDDTQ